MDEGICSRITELSRYSGGLLGAGNLIITNKYNQKKVTFIILHDKNVQLGEKMQ